MCPPNSSQDTTQHKKTVFKKKVEMAENIFTLMNSGNWFDMNDLCRICGTVSHQFLPIYNDDDVVDQNLIQIITEHMPILQVSKNDALSLHVCYQCASTLVAWNEFYSTAINANKLMKSLLNSSRMPDIDELCTDEMSELDKNDDIIEEKHLIDLKSEEIIIKQNDSENDERLLQKDENKTNERKQLTVERIPCPQCEKTFFWDENLKVHIRRMHGGGFPRKFKCDSCEKRFMVKADLVSHKRIHSGEKPFVCDLCGKSFRQSSTLSRHRKVELGLKDHPCKFCSKSFINKHRLQRHINSVHLNIRDFLCTICGNNYQRQHLLTEHLRVHTGERPFNCEFCQKTFRRKSNLRSHLTHCKNSAE